MIQAILFDLDGTFADTAPDLAYALNETLISQKQAPLPFEKIRPVVSHGGRALIELGFGLGPEDVNYEPLRQKLLDIYLNNIAKQTNLFDGMEELLSIIEQKKMKWGIVTNKPSWLTDPLMRELTLFERAACIVSGDTTQNKKPHPEPLFHACEIAQVDPKQCIYVGDAERDIEAGRAAGMKTVAALFGYIQDHDDPDSWDADYYIQHPSELIPLVNC